MMSRSVRLACTFALLLLLASSWGCVRRRLTIVSNPPGAVVFIDDQEIGVTPVSTAFTYYGVRKIQLMKDGYETLTVHQKIAAPWYELPVAEFVSENLWPGDIRDNRRLEFELVPQQIVPVSRLLHRAEGLRLQSHQGIAAVIPGKGQPLVAPPAPPYLPRMQLPGQFDSPAPITGEPLDGVVTPLPPR